jgi:hypothetical protein
MNMLSKITSDNVASSDPMSSLNKLLPPEVRNDPKVHAVLVTFLQWCLLEINPAIIGSATTFATIYKRKMDELGLTKPLIKQF